MIKASNQITNHHISCASTMERHIQIFLNKISYLSITIATLTLLITFIIQTPPQTCITNPDSNHKPHVKSSCDASQRRITTLDHKNHRLWSTNTWRKSVHSFTSLFAHLQSLKRISNHTHALVVSAGGGQAVMALKELGLDNVTGVELVESLPLVVRADPHNLPFFDEVFGLGFSSFLDQALFPVKYVREMERCVKVGGVIVVCVEACGDEGVTDVVELFRKSTFSLAENVTLMGTIMTMIVMERVKGVS